MDKEKEVKIPAVCLLCKCHLYYRELCNTDALLVKSSVGYCSDMRVRHTSSILILKNLSCVIVSSPYCLSMIFTDGI